MIFGIAGMLGELLFTALIGLLFYKNKTLKGHTYLYMLPIYGLGALLYHPAYFLAQNSFIVSRGLFYMLIIFIVEYLTGYLLKKAIDSCPWDYSESGGYHLHGLIRLDYAPIWFFVGLVGERLYLYLA